VAFLVGCDQAALMKSFTPTADESIARNCVDLLRQEKFDQIERQLDPTLVDSNLRNTLAEMAALFPNGDPESVKVVGLNVSQRQEYSATTIQLEYEFPGKWLLVSVTTQKKEGVSTIVGFHANTIPDSLEDLYKFRLVGKSAGEYLILALAICSLVFSFCAFVACIRTNLGTKKWLWMLFVLVGAGKMAVNWTTGEWTFTLLAIQIPCAQATARPYGPWTVAVVLPLGAILFLNHLRIMKVKGELVERPIDAAK
jgi:hypothetical protein